MSTLAGIARHTVKKGPTETLESSAVTLELGVVGDICGVRRPSGRNARQVTLMTLPDWNDACRDLGREIAWHLRRVNLLVDGDLPREAGALVAIGDLVLEITGECDPCKRMEDVAVGLRAALTPDWRGGRLARVVVPGTIAVGDAVSAAPLREAA